MSNTKDHPEIFFKVDTLGKRYAIRATLPDNGKRLNVQYVTSYNESNDAAKYRAFLNEDKALFAGVMVGDSTLEISDCSRKICLEFDSDLYINNVEITPDNRDDAIKEIQTKTNKSFDNICGKISKLQKALDLVQARVDTDYAAMNESIDLVREYTKDNDGNFKVSINKTHVWSDEINTDKNLKKMLDALDLDI